MYCGTEMIALSFVVKRSKFKATVERMLEPLLHRQRHTVLNVWCRMLELHRYIGFLIVCPMQCTALDRI